MKTEPTLFLSRIPALLCHAQALKSSVRKGTVLFYHGLGASKEVHLAEIERLVSAGFLVIAVDAVGHGQRRDPELERLTAAGSPVRAESFLRVVQESAMELPLLLDDLHSRGWIYRGRIGISGISMGGYICFLGITLEPRLKVAVSILGSPEWKAPSAMSPHNRLERFSDIRLLSQNAGRDELVSSAAVKRFHSRLRETYADYGDRFEYIEYPLSRHFMAEQDWRLCIERSAAWFDLHMSRN